MTVACRPARSPSQEVLIVQLQKKLTELSKNPSPATGPANPIDGRPGKGLDMEALGLGLAALGERHSPDLRHPHCGDAADKGGNGNGNGNGNRNRNGNEVAAEVVS